MIKPTGIIRPVDKLGRIVIPREIRKMLGVRNDIDSFEIFMQDADCIVLKKYQPCCMFCGTLDNCVRYHGKLICVDCIEKLKDERENQKERLEEEARALREDPFYN